MFRLNIERGCGPGVCYSNNTDSNREEITNNSIQTLTQTKYQKARRGINSLISRAPNEDTESKTRLEPSRSTKDKTAEHHIYYHVPASNSDSNSNYNSYSSENETNNEKNKNTKKKKTMKKCKTEEEKNKKKKHEMEKKTEEHEKKEIEEKIEQKEEKKENVNEQKENKKSTSISTTNAINPPPKHVSNIEKKIKEVKTKTNKHKRHRYHKDFLDFNFN